MYLFTTVPYPHGHWQLQELLGNTSLRVNPPKPGQERISTRLATFTTNTQLQVNSGLADTIDIHFRRYHLVLQ